MKVIDTKFKGLKIIQQKKHKDRRGNLRETFIKKIIKWNELIFDYATTSKKNVLRGFHFQLKKPQGKLIKVIEGKIFDVFVDLRLKSSTFGKWDSLIISSKYNKILWLPPGIAHGFFVISSKTIINYKVTEFYDSNDEYTLKWNDKNLTIGNKIKIEAKLPHVPGANFMYPTKKIDTKILVKFFIRNLYY